MTDTELKHAALLYAKNPEKYSIKPLDPSNSLYMDAKKIAAEEDRLLKEVFVGVMAKYAEADVLTTEGKEKFLKEVQRGILSKRRGFFSSREDSAKLELAKEMAINLASNIAFKEPEKMFKNLRSSPEGLQQIGIFMPKPQSILDSMAKRELARNASSGSVSMYNDGSSIHSNNHKFGG